MLKRAFVFIPSAVRQFVPLNGIFAGDWQAATAIGVYWFESLLLAAVAVVLCWQVKRRSSDRAIADARNAGDGALAAALLAEQRAATKAGIDPSGVLLFHIGSLGMFGAFLGGLLLILTLNGHLDRPFDWGEFRDGAEAMAVIIAVSFVIELVFFPSMSIAAVQSRVDACTSRWALLWILGFFGTGLLAFTGKASVFLGLFAALKVTWEAWGALTRLFQSPTRAGQ